MIVLDLLPLDVRSTEAPRSSATRVYLSLRDSSKVLPDTVPSVLDDARQQWNAAFSRCYVYTLRSLCFPTAYNSTNRPKEMRPKTILSVLASGQPLPRSPSLQLQDPHLDPTNQEREERVWWAARFRRILEEVTLRDELEDFTPHLVSEIKNPILQAENLASTEAPNRSTSLLKEATSKLFRLKR